jgi:hypothetical protein
MSENDAMDPHSPSPSEVIAEAERQGVDLSMLRERLRLTPTERLERHQAALALVEALRSAKRKAKRVSPGDLAECPHQS